VAILITDYRLPITDYRLLITDYRLLEVYLPMLIILIKVLHIAVAVFLILVVLLQTGKGAEMGAAFGGSSQTLFGGAGPAGFMAKLTTAAAVCFMLTSLGLAYVSSANRLVGDIQLPASQQIPAQIPVETAPGVTPEASPQASPDTSPETSQIPEGSTAVPPAAGEQTDTQTQ